MAATVMLMAVQIATVAATSPGRLMSSPVTTESSSSVHLIRAPRDREGEAQRMLQVIRESLSRGDIPTAERQMQILGERHPDSDASAEARRLLGRLQDPAPPAPRPAPLAPPPPVMARPEPPRPAEPIERPAATHSWSTEVRRTRALAQDFKATTGDRIFFSDGSTDIGSRARAVLSAQADWLKRFPQVPVTLVAHADDRGGKELNEDLSIRRGEAVKARLIAEGIDEKRIRVLPVGREQMVATCTAPGCSAQNRRVVTMIGDGEQAAIQRRP
jgi:peptidoglycan-associated lipoprotein